MPTLLLIEVVGQRNRHVLLWGLINDEQPLHLTLPPIFLILATRIIEIKRETACAVFCIPIDYRLKMRLNENFFEQLTGPLPHEMALRMDYVIRTLIRTVNEKGCALLLHNPLFLFDLHQSLFTNRPSTEDSQVTLRMPHFPADIFVLMESASERTELTDTPPPLMSASSSESEGESKAVGNPSDVLEYVNDRVDVRAHTTKKEEQNRASPPPYSPGMRMKIWFYSSNLPMPFKTFIDRMVSSPVETQSILPRAPTPILGTFNAVGTGTNDGNGCE